MSIRGRLALGLLILQCLLCSHAQATRFCFADAETYFEQLYCEIDSELPSANLPDFYDFRKNDETTQALLLKRPAARLGITVSKPATATRGARVQSVPDLAAIPQCVLRGDTIECANSQYLLVRNKANSKLAPGALGETNAMALPQKAAGGESREDYLLRAYDRYLDKMLAIGLGGVTMSYGRFAYLYDDLAVRGVSFNERFETMYRFLKKDKATMLVSLDKPDVSQLALEDCAALPAHAGAPSKYWVCSSGRKNYVFARAN